MEDPSSGALAPAGGAPRDAATSARPPAGQSSAAGSTSGTDGRGAPGHKSKKRRKRRRGRKVFAREPNTAANGQSGAPRPILEPVPVAAIQPAAPPAAQPIVMPRRTYRQELPVFAALDLGTNNCRLLVAVPGRPGQFRVIDAFSRIVRLGEGLSLTGRLSDQAMARAIEALKICGEKLGNRQISKARLIATEACRAAANGADFLDRVKAEAGIELEIIDRETEARLAVSGCGSLVERETEGVVLFDIGGGSSEVALIDLTGKRSPRLANHIVSWTSLPVGVVSLAERFGGRDVTRATFAAMVAEVCRLLENFPGKDRLDHVRASPNFHLLGTSGTVTTLAGVHLGLERYDRRRVDGLWMDRVNVDLMVERLLSWDFPTRVANPCIGADRADLVLAGCAILEGIRAVWPSERLRVADRGLREGILSELMGDAGVWRHGWRPGS